MSFSSSSLLRLIVDPQRTVARDIGIPERIQHQVPPASLLAMSLPTDKLKAMFYLAFEKSLVTTRDDDIWWPWLFS